MQCLWTVLIYSVISWPSNWSFSFHKTFFWKQNRMYRDPVHHQSLLFCPFQGSFQAFLGTEVVQGTIYLYRMVHCEDNTVLTGALAYSMPPAMILVHKKEMCCRALNEVLCLLIGWPVVVFPNTANAKEHFKFTCDCFLNILPKLSFLTGHMAWYLIGGRGRRNIFSFLIHTNWTSHMIQQC